MSIKFRSRTFLYLLVLLGLFAGSQAITYTAVEYVHRVANPYESFREGLEEVLQATGLTVLLLVPLTGAAWWIARRITRPLHAVAATAKRIRGGRWDERIETTTMPDDETKVLAETVNAAFDGYAGALRRLERFSGDAAHQLRTPIAAMRNLGEVALSRARSAADYREALETMLGELDRLTRIVEQLLQLSRLEAGALKARFAPIPLGSVVEQVRQIYQPLAEVRGVELAVATSDARVAGIEELLVELLGNLVDNALRHTPKRGTVRIEVGAAAGEVRLAVTDSGPGIPDEFAQKIFERFTQVPGSETGTAGLGLALAAQIAAVHGGEVKLANPGQPGARPRPHPAAPRRASIDGPERVDPPQFLQAFGKLDQAHDPDEPQGAEHVAAIGGRLHFVRRRLGKQGQAREVGRHPPRIGVEFVVETPAQAAFFVADDPWIIQGHDAEQHQRKRQRFRAQADAQHADGAEEIQRISARGIGALDDQPAILEAGDVLGTPHAPQRCDGHAGHARGEQRERDPFGARFPAACGEHQEKHHDGRSRAGKGQAKFFNRRFHGSPWAGAAGVVGSVATSYSSQT